MLAVRNIANRECFPVFHLHYHQIPCLNFLLIRRKTCHVREELKEKAGLVLIRYVAWLVLRGFIADRQHVSVQVLNPDGPSSAVKANRT